MLRINKMRVVVIALCTALLCSGTPSFAGGGPRDTNIVKVVERVQPSVVRIAWPKDGVMDVIGSGFVVDSRGYILTNFHVIEDVAKVFVGLYGGTAWLEATVVTADKGNDLALLKVEAKKPLPELQFGPSSDLKVGEPVIAFGNPLDEHFTVTHGIVSKVQVPFERKDASGGVNKMYLTQTDAPINPGNSGGPLVNALGEVIGVIELKKRGADGLAWAITSDRAARVLSKHVNAEKHAGVVHGVKEFDLKVNAKKGKQRQAVIVKTLADKGPAATAGLKAGDRVLKVGKRPVNNAFDFERAFWDNKPGDKVTLTVERDGAEVKVEVTLEGDGIAPEIKD